LIKRAIFIGFMLSLCCIPLRPEVSRASAPAPQPADQKSEKKTLANSDVVTMVNAGLADSTIVLDIQNSPTAFDTAPQALIFLQRSGVSQTVIDAMIASASGKPIAPQPSAPVPPVGAMPASVVPTMVPKSNGPRPDMHKIRKVYLEMDWADDEKARPRAIQTLKKRTCLQVVDSLDQADAKLAWENQGLMGVGVKLYTKDDVEIWSGRSFVNPLKALRRDLGCEP
jgi:hypothetical protein